MNELINIKTNENGEQLVSGRELHNKLRIGTKYTQWMDRMISYGFSESIDFTLVSQKWESSNITGIKEVTDHIMTLDMAKQIAMIQRNEIGMKIRQYFIDVEKQYNSPEMIMKRALMYANQKVEALQLENKMQEQQIHELKPKADYTDKILQSKKLVSITQIAKDYGMSGQAMNEKLHELKVQYKQSNQWLLYAKYQDKGYTHSETVEIQRSNGMDDVVMNTKWTQKGRLFLYNLLKDNGILPSIEREWRA